MRYSDLCARCENQFPPGQVCDGCKASTKRPVLAWFGQLATATLGYMLAVVIVHLLGFSWPA